MRPSVGILPTLDWHWRDCVTTAVAVGCDEASDDLPLLRAGRFSHLLRKSGRGRVNWFAEYRLWDQSIAHLDAHSRMEIPLFRSPHHNGFLRRV